MNVIPILFYYLEGVVRHADEQNSDMNVKEWFGPNPNAPPKP